MLRRLRELAGRGEDFSFETTLAGRSFAPLLREMRAAGYRIRLDFLWIPSLDVTRNRVRQRVSKDGHDIPDEVQLRRFHLGVRNLAELYRPLVQRWRLLENTGETPYLVAEEQDGRLSVSDIPLHARIEREASVRLMPDVPLFSVEEPACVWPDAETRAALRALRKAFADAVLENLRFGLPVIQYLDGKMVETPAGKLAPLARRILAANGELLPEEKTRGRVS